MGTKVDRASKKGESIIAQNTRRVFDRVWAEITPLVPELSRDAGPAEKCESAVCNTVSLKVPGKVAQVCQ